MALDAILHGVSTANDVPWEMITGIYDEIEEAAAFERPWTR